MFSIDAIMSTNLITIKPDGSLAEARSLMQENRIHHLPVLDDKGEMIGLVTLTNLLAATDSVLREVENRIHAVDNSVVDVMVTDLATVDRNASLRQAALFLEKHRIGCLPVTDHGKLHGIITDTDFVGVAINLLEQIEDTEPMDDDVAEASF
jgi:CBS domain-containing membrane protein